MSKSPTTLTATETEKLIKHISEEGYTWTQHWKSKRNTLMVLLMLDAGLRVGEVCKLRVDDLFIGGEAVETLRIRKEITKSKATRYVPMSERLRIAIAALDESKWRTINGIKVGFAFYVKDESKSLTTRQVERLLRAAGMEAIGRPVHPHVLRHTFASRLMRVTNARVVQQLLGHQNLSTTQIYTHPNGDDCKSAIENL